MEIKECEIWKDIKGYEGLYQISNYGRVKRLVFVNNVCSKPKETIINPCVKDNKYLYVSLHKDGCRKNKYIHRLVAEAFISNPNCYPVVNHIDYDVTNNKLDNLEWCSQKDNVEHSVIHMRKDHRKCRPSNTGEKYIIYTQGRYRVCIKNSRVNYDKCFAALVDAIAFRNEVMNGGSTV